MSRLNIRYALVSKSLVHSVLLSIALSIGFVNISAAQIPVTDKKQENERRETKDNVTGVRDTNRSTTNKAKSITCSIYKNASNNPRSQAEANPEIVGLVRRIAREEGVDEALFVSLVYQESRFNPCARSHANAYGLSQLIPGTASDLGVNRYDIEDNLRGGARYLRQQLRRFGNVPEALAAYNAGPGNVRKYGGIPPFKETQGYVRNITQKWLPVFGGGTLNQFPEFRGGGNAVEKGSRSSIQSGATIAATTDSLSDVGEWLSQQTQGETGSLLESFDVNTGTRQSNLAMINKFIELGGILVELKNQRNALDASSIAGSVETTRPRPPQRDPGEPQAITCGEGTECIVDDSTDVVNLGPEQTQECHQDGEIYDRQTKQCVVVYDRADPALNFSLNNLRN